MANRRDIYNIHDAKFMQGLFGITMLPAHRLHSFLEMQIGTENEPYISLLEEIAGQLFHYDIKFEFADMLRKFDRLRKFLPTIVVFDTNSFVWYEDVWARLEPMYDWDATKPMADDFIYIFSSAVRVGIKPKDYTVKYREFVPCSRAPFKTGQSHWAYESLRFK